MLFQHDEAVFGDLNDATWKHNNAQDENSLLYQLLSLICPALPMRKPPFYPE